MRKLKISNPYICIPIGEGRYMKLKTDTKCEEEYLTELCPCLSEERAHQLAKDLEKYAHNDMRALTGMMKAVYKAFEFDKDFNCNGCTLTSPKRRREYK